MPFQFIDNILLKCLALQLCPCIVFPSKKTFNKEVLPNLVENTEQTYVLPILLKCVSTITSFDLWMSKRAHDVNFLGENCIPKHIRIG